jgi:radical SAM superfamily enzyme YgiQ (UPF0313 family)
MRNVRLSVFAQTVSILEKVLESFNASNRRKFVVPFSLDVILMAAPAVARELGPWVVHGGIHAMVYPEEAHELGAAHSVVKGDGDLI